MNLFYAESASVVYYLISEMGSYRFVRFCRELKDTPFENALSSVYSRFNNLERLNDSWIKYLKQ